MKIDLTNKKALVCGASQGIGYETAKALAACGAQVVAVARNTEKLQKLVADLPGRGHDFASIDLSNATTLRPAIDALMAQHGGFHIVVNNSGGPKGGRLIDATPETILEAFTPHLVAAHLVVLATVPFMTNAGFGRIINITSIGQKQPIVGLGVSNVVRGAMGSWAKTLAAELGPLGITVNNILPGFTETPRLQEVNQLRAAATQQSLEEVEKGILADVPINRFINPAETAATIAFLCSDFAAAITGSQIAVDGGRISGF